MVVNGKPTESHWHPKLYRHIDLGLFVVTEK
jgi:hypothetical protein